MKIEGISGKLEARNCVQRQSAKTSFAFLFWNLLYIFKNMLTKLERLSRPNLNLSKKIRKVVMK